MPAFTGVSTAVTIADEIEALPQKKFDEFVMARAVRQRYLEKYVGPCDRRSAESLTEPVGRSHNGR